MAAEEAQWNQPELVRAFEDWRIGSDGMRDQHLLEELATPRHIEDLYIGTRDLLEQKAVASEYRFSDEAMAAVRQSREAYIDNVLVPKCQLFLATAIRLVDGETRLARMYNTQMTFEEVVKRYRLHPDSLGEVVELGGVNPDHSYSSIQHINTFYEDILEEPGGATLYRYPPSELNPSGQTVKKDPRLTMADYVTFGHMIEHDLNH